MQEIPAEALTLWGSFAALLQLLIVAAVTLRVMLTRHPPGSAFAWILLTAILPYVGFVLYLLFGERPIGRIRARRLRKSLDMWAKIGRHRLTPHGPLPPRMVRHRTFIHQATHVGGMPLTSGSDVRLLGSSDEAFAAIAAEIDGAKRSVDLAFYIWESGGAVDAIESRLIAAARRGVKVRILVDAFGSRAFLRSPQKTRLTAAGVRVASAMPLRFLWIFGLQRADIRLHRKVVVVDRRVGFTGSLNMIDPMEYDAAKTVGPWVDAMVRFEGPAVLSLQGLWDFDWALQPDGDASDFEYVYGTTEHPQTGRADVVAVPSGPYARQDQGLLLVLGAIGHAEYSLTIVSPYFVPNEAVVLALQNAVLRGVDVKLIVPHKTDSRFVSWAARRYFDDLLTAGVKILYYEGGLLHTKSITVDDECALFGSLNIDNRSMHLNFELTMLIFEPGFVRELNALHARYEASSTPIDPNRWRERPIKERLKEGASYLISPLL